MKILTMVAAALALAACAPKAQSAFSIDSAVIAPPLGGKDVTAAYFTLRNAGPADKLVSASSPVAKSIEFHISEMTDGMMSMRRIASIDAPANGTVTLAPGGMHMMLFGVSPDLQAGADEPVTIVFEKAGPQTFTFKVQPIGAEMSGMGGAKP
jgi:periplasmic copper chaperone A